MWDHNVCFYGKKRKRNIRHKLSLLPLLIWSYYTHPVKSQVNHVKLKGDTSRGSNSATFISASLLNGGGKLNKNLLP